ncbi:MAG: hypothetical protein KY460_17405 [Actinobacteria bacterium]|nr:hypothetical protein [Actinomycetota bacterium]
MSGPPLAPVGELRVTVEPDTVDVAPGTAATVHLRIHSTADVPVDVVIAALGPHAAWCTPTPHHVQIAAGGAAQIQVIVRITDRAPVSRHTAVVGLRATATRRGVLPHVAELRVRVPVTIALRLDLVPPTQRVSGRARFAAVVRNDGTVPLQVRMEPGDMPPEVVMRVRPSTVHVKPRGRARARVAVRAAPPWAGPEPAHTFTVRAVTGDHQVEALGSFVQRTRSGTAVLALAGGLVVVGLLFLLLLVGVVG